MTGLDTELSDLPPELRWREWMGRVEAVIFASPEPVTREMLARIVGRDCALDLLIEDINAELADHAYDIVSVAGGWQFRTKPRYADAIRTATAPRQRSRSLTPNEVLVLAIIAYLQPVTRGAMSRLIGQEVSRDLIGRLRRQDLITRGPRSPEPGAPYTYVTAPRFLEKFDLKSLRDLPDLEALEDAGLLEPRADIDLDFPISAGEQ